ncbi:aldehyde dehydrogenase family protein [Escherichia coli]|uniref:aldehyde dehydrogenase family protein n=1 Tax=Escherichia coli TaxID=562 RepID=UPI0022EFEA1D|nr:aldehyde dehydrogenase family protein [Escherichia coli]MDA4330460.1 aldehyde dehydrogenase family protein [Escherichia coli]
MSVPVQHPMYIDGQFVTWRGDAWIDVVNPATEAVISRIPDGQAEDARKAIDAAERAQPEWEALPAIERASWLRKISVGIRERASEISALIVEEGARVALGGKAVEGKGYYYPPTLLLDVRQEMSIMHEETFGPVLPVVAFDTLEDAIAMANDSDYGLTSSIYTQNLNVAMKAIKGLKFGETYINRENFEAMQGFHAGWRKSGIGGADGKHGLHEYLQTQVVYLQS